MKHSLPCVHCGYHPAVHYTVEDIRRIIEEKNAVVRENWELKRKLEEREEK